jgi:hypothetical protein
MKYKTIPVWFKDRIVTHIDEVPPVCTRVYDKYWRLYNIGKVHHVRGKRVVIEDKARVRRVNL